MNRKIIYNTAQLNNILFPTKIRYNLWGRGGGKSFDLARDSAEMAHEMPGGSFVFMARSYALLEGISFQGILAGWKALGYYPGVHYEIKKRPDKNKKWPDPFVPPISYDHFIPWYTGAGFYLASQDKDSPFRGPSIEGIYVDEALTIKKDRFDEEISPTNRGNRFKHPLRHFTKFSSTKPLGSDGNWLLNANKYYGDKLPLIKRLQKESIELKLELIDSRDIDQQKYLFKEIQKIDKELSYYPDKENKIFYSEYDGFCNLKNIGLDYFRNNKLTMSILKFRSEILNETMEEIEDGFYPSFNEKHLNYDTFNYNHIDLLTSDQRETERDCRWDKDIFYNLPLKHVVDWGGWINSSLTWQRNGKLINVTNHQWVKHPLKIKDLADKFMRYYRYFPLKHVILHFDHTGINKKDNTDLTSSEEYASYLRTGGWTVTIVKGGGAPTHGEKYFLNQKVMSGHDSALPSLILNANNCTNLITALKLTPIKKGNRGVEKDKSSEKDKNFPQEQSTHAPDCLDIIIGAEASRRTSHSFRDPLD